MPKNPDGSRNLNAPAPRLDDGHPDFSGLWEPIKNRPCPPEGCDDIQVPWEFVNIGWSLKDGLPIRPWAAELKRKRQENYSMDDPASNCLPVGIVKSHTAPLLKKATHTPGLLVFLYERGVNYRQIFTDGRPFPEDMQPTWNGYSTGHWDGDTLVVETRGSMEDGWLDRGGTPMTADAKITEKFRRVNFGRLEIELTVDDLKAYTRPWTVTLIHLLALDTDLLDYVCLENEDRKSTRLNSSH